MSFFYEILNDGTPYRRKKLRVKRLILTIAAALFMLITLLCSFAIIPSGYTGVRTTFGQIDTVAVSNGFTYWERIERKESYLLFVRKASAPDTSYYTVEAEPNGTVRQVRTVYNRQNDDIGEVRAFLKIWQKQLAKQLTQKDKQLAADSHELRVKELVQLRNDQITVHTGDLAGRLLVDVLTEDLMEAA